MKLFPKWHQVLIYQKLHLFLEKGLLGSKTKGQITMQEALSQEQLETRQFCPILCEKKHQATKTTGSQVMANVTINKSSNDSNSPFYHT